MTLTEAQEGHHPIRVSEIFGPTVQGEGPLMGRPTIFVRTGGCDFRCTWCDTPYAVLSEHREEWSPMRPVDVVAEVLRCARSSPMLVTLSGGNPALQALHPVVKDLQGHGFEVAMETQGSVARRWFWMLDHLVVSPKGPSSGMLDRFDALLLAEVLDLGPMATSLKFVVFEEDDLRWARSVWQRHRDYRAYLQVGNPDHHPDQRPDPGELLRRLAWLMERTLELGWLEATVLPQLHVLAWGNRRGT